MNVSKTVAKIQDKWQDATREERHDMIAKLRDAEGSLAEDDAVTRTEIGALIERIQRANDAPQTDYAVPETNTGEGYGFGTFPTRLD
jgi:hypothetical protein